MARMDALTVSLAPSSIPQSSSQIRLGPDAVLPQPGVTAGESRTFQALGVDSRTSVGNAQLGQGVRAPRQEFVGPSAAPQHHAAPGPAPQPSASFVPPQPPPRYGDPPPQPSTSGWVPSGPPPPRSRGSRSESELEASESESEFSACDSASARLADLIYEACPESRPLSDDARQPRYGFESWFGQPESFASRPHFRLYPRVGAVESEVAARAEALAHRSKSLSQLLPSRGCGSTALFIFTSHEPVLCPVGGGQIRSVETLGLHLLLGDGAAGATIPESARDVFIVSLADVRNISHAETRWFSAGRPNLLQCGPGLRLGDPVSTGSHFRCWLCVYPFQTP